MLIITTTPGQRPSARGGPSMHAAHAVGSAHGRCLRGACVPMVMAWLGAARPAEAQCTICSGALRHGQRHESLRWRRHSPATSRWRRRGRGRRSAEGSEVADNGSTRRQKGVSAMATMWEKVAARRRLPTGTVASSSSGGGTRLQTVSSDAALEHDGEMGDGFGRQQSAAFGPALSASDTGAAAGRRFMA
jgi:hypothetical protein